MKINGQYIYAWCVDCSRPLPGIHRNRLAKGKKRRCIDCYQSTVSLRYVDEKGYLRTRIERKRSAKYKYEHRLVMERLIGRTLKQTEIVHHKNGNRADNRPENLELCENAGKHVLDHGHISRGKDGKFVAGWKTAKDFKK